MAEAGQLRHRIQRQYVSRSRDDAGGNVETWLSGDTRWGSIRQLSAREKSYAEQVKSRATHRMEFRGWADLTTQDRLVFETRIYEIESVEDAGERGIDTIVMAVETKEFAAGTGSGTGSGSGSGSGSGTGS